MIDGLEGKRSWPWARWFVVLSAILGLLSVFTTPALGGPDELRHMARLAYIDRGALAMSGPTGTTVDKCLADYFTDQSLYNLAKESRSWTGQFKTSSCHGGGQVDIEREARTAEVYSPIPYVPALVGFHVAYALGGPAAGLFGARLLQLAAFIAMLAYAIGRIPWGKPLLFTLGLLPVVLSGAAAVSADPVTFALVCVLVAEVLAIGTRGRAGEVVTSKRLILLASVVVALAFSKSAYVPMVGLVALVPSIAFGSRRRHFAAVGTMLVAAGAVAAAWNIGVVSHIDIVGVNHSDSVAAASIIREHPKGFIQSILNGWGNPIERPMALKGMFTIVHRFETNFPLPLWFGVPWLLLARLVEPVPVLVDRVTSAVRSRLEWGGTAPHRSGEPGDDDVIAPRSNRWIEILVAAGIGMMCFLLVEYGIAIAANPPGTRHVVWVQGRYFLPLLPLSLFGAANVGARRNRLQLVLPVVSVAVFCWWLIWSVQRSWGWL